MVFHGKLKLYASTYKNASASGEFSPRLPTGDPTRGPPSQTPCRIYPHGSYRFLEMPLLVMGSVLLFQFVRKMYIVHKLLIGVGCDFCCSSWICGKQAPVYDVCRLFSLFWLLMFYFDL